MVVAGGPELVAGTMAERLAVFRDRHDAFRSAVVNEPRGSDVMVGALVLEPLDPSAAAGVIYFNNVGYLGMCGHGTIGVAVALAHLGRIDRGTHRLETPVGPVAVTLEGPNTVAIDNVESYRLARDVVGRRAGTRAVRGRRRLGRQLVLPGPRPRRDPSMPRTSSGWAMSVAGSRMRWPSRGSLAPTAARSTISSCSARPIARMPTARTSSSVRATPTIDPPAARAPARSSPAWSPTASSSRDRSGDRRASSAACSRARCGSSMAGSGPGSGGPPTSMPNPP